MQASYPREDKRACNMLRIRVRTLKGNTESLQHIADMYFNVEIINAEINKVESSQGSMHQYRIQVVVAGLIHQGAFLK